MIFFHSEENLKWKSWSQNWIWNKRREWGSKSKYLVSRKPSRNYNMTWHRQDRRSNKLKTRWGNFRGTYGRSRLLRRCNILTSTSFQGTQRGTQQRIGERERIFAEAERTGEKIWITGRRNLHVTYRTESGIEEDRRPPGRAAEWTGR